MEMNVDQLALEFESANLRRRRDLAQAAVSGASNAELARVARLVAHPSQNVRLGAIEALEIAQFRPAMGVLVAVAKTRRGDERVYAARCIASLAEPSDRESLQTLAKDWVESSDNFLPLHGKTLYRKLGLALPERRLGLPVETTTLEEELDELGVTKEQLAEIEDGGQQDTAIGRTIKQLVERLRDGVADISERSERSESRREPAGRSDEIREAVDDYLGTLSGTGWVEESTERELRALLSSLPLSGQARREVGQELRRMEVLPRDHYEYDGIRKFLQFVADLPWGRRASGGLPAIDVAARRLDSSHTGLKEPKRRILEYLAVEKLCGKPSSRVLCFVGPPGVGKTSLGKAIAGVLNRPFLQLSLGGVDDEVAIRGFERSYLKSRPGRLLRGLVRVGVKDPVLLFDEVDKLGRRWSDPAAALLEVLDPECNREFTDSYLQFPFDLSEVFFVCTANSIEGIDPILRDRMQVVELSGYTRKEKLDLARVHVVPRALDQNGLVNRRVTVSESAVEEIVGNYTFEAGVRELVRCINTVCRGVALALAREGESCLPIVVESTDVADYLGPVRFRSDRAEAELPPGVATGLCRTAAGGLLQWVECAITPHGNGKIQLTGRLDETVKESAHLAISYVRRRAGELGVSAGLLESCDIHLHLPGGAIPKEGSSAGLAAVLALLSSLRGQPLPGDTGVTGEISLSGKLLPVGAVKEKLLGASAAGLRRVVLPGKNRNDVAFDLLEVDDLLELLYVDDVGQAISALLPQPSTATR